MRIGTKIWLKQPGRPGSLPCSHGHAIRATPQFRAYERRENDESEDEDGYEGDFEEGGSDPFLAPVSSQGTRMFMYIRSMNKETSDRLATLEQQVGDLLQASTTPSAELPSTVRRP